VRAESAECDGEKPVYARDDHEHPFHRDSA
jgi:hypothetical protein